VDRVRERLEKCYGSVYLAFTAIKARHVQEEFTLKSLHQGLLKVGVDEEDAGILLQAIMETMLNSSDKCKQRRCVPTRSEFTHFLTPGRLPQAPVDMARRRLGSSMQWPGGSGALTTINVGRIPHGLSHRDAQTILKAC